MLSRPCINTFIIHVILFFYVFAVLALGDYFTTTTTTKKWYSFHCIYWYVTYYVLLWCIWSDVLWSRLVKWFYSESFQIMTKDKHGHRIIICHFCLYRTCCHLHIAPRAGTLRRIKSSNVWLGACRESKKCWPLILVFWKQFETNGFHH